MSILSERKNVITTNSRSDHNDADLSSIFGGLHYVCELVS